MMAAALTACAHAPGAEQRLHAQGRLGDDLWAGGVDHPAARYYLQSYLAGVRDDSKLDAQFDAWHAQWSGRLPNSDELAALARTHSTDLSALLFAQQAQQLAQRHPLYRSFRRTIETPAAGALQLDSRIVYLFAPGWRYRSEPATGADFQRFRDLLGRHSATVAIADVEENGTVERNAELLAQSVRAQAQTGRTVVLVSGSKGGPEAALALESLHAQHDPALARVGAWVNIGGLLKGTPLADMATQWPACWLVWLAILRGDSFDGVRSLRHTGAVARHLPPTLPLHLLVVNYIGVPLASQVSERGRMGYRLLRDFGPNDGLTLLADAVAPGGLTLVHPGSDHYLQAADIEQRTLALAKTVETQLLKTETAVTASLRPR